MTGGIITSSQNVPVMTRPLSELKSTRYVLFIPGGTGVKELVNNDTFIATLKSLAMNAEFIITVCNTLIPDRYSYGETCHFEQTVVCLDKNCNWRELDKESPLGKRWHNVYQFGSQCRDGLGIGIRIRPAGVSCSKTGEPGD